MDMVQQAKSFMLWKIFLFQIFFLGLIWMHFEEQKGVSGTGVMSVCFLFNSRIIY